MRQGEVYANVDGDVLLIVMVPAPHENGHDRALCWDTPHSGSGDPHMSSMHKSWFDPASLKYYRYTRLT